jgi:hypothetical protein
MPIKHGVGERGGTHEHIPLAHALPDGQACPQAPQLFVSELVLVQVPLHRVWGGLQPALQVPLVQGTPPAHVVPQLPQLEGSEEVVVQMPPHDVPRQASVSPLACILYSTKRLASAPVFEVHVEPVRSEALRVEPAANVKTMGPLSDQY